MNRSRQYILQLIQVFFVGLTLGTMRTVVPAVADSDFGVREGDLALISMFVIAFGIVKGSMNFIAGTMSERFGRRWVLIVGWIIALPIPWMIWQAPNDASGWWWIVAATVLLGINQGLTWSMTLTSKLDLAREDRRGLANGLNEFSGYFAVALAGVVTGLLADRHGARIGLLAFGYAVILPALFIAIVFVRETQPLPRAEGGRAIASTRTVFARSFRDRAFFAWCQCGLVEKFIDCLMWIAMPIFLVQRGIDLRDVGWIPGAYAATWGCAQIATGPLSDRVGRKPLVVGGMFVCAAGVALMPRLHTTSAWGACAAFSGLGMAMLYPTLGAAISDFAPHAWRATALGVYRFWRDLGYAIGAALMGLLAAFGFGIESSFTVIAALVAASGLVVAMLAPGRTRSVGPSIVVSP